jgi:hypothetical protein
VATALNIAKEIVVRTGRDAVLPREGRSDGVLHGMEPRAAADGWAEGSERRGISAGQSKLAGSSHIPRCATALPAAISPRHPAIRKRWLACRPGQLATALECEDGSESFRPLLILAPGSGEQRTLSPQTASNEGTGACGRCCIGARG